MEFYLVPRPLSFIPEYIFFIRPTSQGNDVRMFEEKEGIGNFPFDARGDTLFLQSNRLFVRDVPEETYLADQRRPSSKFSSVFLTTTMN
jgi:hypothetical protein